MKLGKIDLNKIKKITAIEIVVVIIVLLAVGIYFSFNFITSFEDRQIAQIKADNAIFTSKLLEAFAKDKNAKPSDVAKKVLEELNKTAKNPFDKSKSAYTLDFNCTKSCNVVVADDVSDLVVLTAYNEKGELVARVVVKPPSYVVYFKGDDKK